MLFRSRLYDHLEIPVKDLIAAHQRQVPRLLLLARVEEELGRESALLKATLKRLLELSLDVSYAVRKNKGSGEVCIMKSSGPDLVSYEQAADALKLEIAKTQVIIRHVLDQLREPMREMGSVHGEERIKIEQMSRDLELLTNRAMFRSLRPGIEDEAPVYVTFVLKTLFIRYLNEDSAVLPPEQRSAELLVTCSVKHSQNAHEAVYPLIFEENYAPSHFVNRHDRIIYGPYPYTGQFFDLRLTILELDDLDNKAILSGFAQAVAAAGAFNPELAVLSPAMTALFGTILNAATENDKEFDVSFTLPAAEGEQKADVDFLMTETGHYILMKRENEHRKEKSLGRAAERMMYRRLIYNPADGKLYRRRYFTRASENFVKDNLFLDQTYAVIAVTDEYVRPDNLGEILREQLSRALGERRSVEFVPDLGRSMQVIQKFRDLRHEQNDLRKDVNLSPEDRRIRLDQVKKSQDELWMQVSELRKQTIVEALYDVADEETRKRLGRDLREWRNAKLDLLPDGRLRLSAKSTDLAKAFVQFPGRAGGESVFAELDPAKQWRYHVLSAQGDPYAAATLGVPSGDATLGTIDQRGFYSCPKALTVPQVGVRAVSIDKSEQPTGSFTRILQFKGDYAFEAKVARDGTTTVEGPVGASVLVDEVGPLSGTVSMVFSATNIPAVGKPIWFVNGKEASAFPIVGWTDGQIEGPKLTLAVKAGVSEKTAEPLRLAVVDDRFKELFSKGHRQGIPGTEFLVTMLNPVSLIPSQVDVMIAKEDRSFAEVKVRIAKEAKGSAEPPPMTVWLEHQGQKLLEVGQLKKSNDAVKFDVRALRPKAPFDRNRATLTVVGEGMKDNTKWTWRRGLVVNIDPGALPGLKVVKQGNQEPIDTDVVIDANDKDPVFLLSVVHPAKGEGWTLEPGTVTWKFRNAFSSSSEDIKDLSKLGVKVTQPEAGVVALSSEKITSANRTVEVWAEVNYGMIEVATRPIRVRLTGGPGE